MSHPLNTASPLTRRALLQSATALGAFGAAGLLPATLPAAFAQTFPSKPIKVLIGVPAGGTQDVLTRAIAEALRTSLGTIIIDNKSGASGRIAVETVKNAEPDGYTLLLGPASLMTMFPSATKSSTTTRLPTLSPSSTPPVLSWRCACIAASQPTTWPNLSPGLKRRATKSTLPLTARVHRRTF